MTYRSAPGSDGSVLLPGTEHPTAVMSRPRCLWQRGRLSLLLEPRDLWAGAFLGPQAVFIALMPCLVLRWER